MLFNRVTPTVSTQTLHFPPLQSGFQRLDIFDFDPQIDASQGAPTSCLCLCGGEALLNASH